MFCTVPVYLFAMFDVCYKIFSLLLYRLVGLTIHIESGFLYAGVLDLRVSSQCSVILDL